MPAPPSVGGSAADSLAAGSGAALIKEHQRLVTMLLEGVSTIAVDEDASESPGSTPFVGGPPPLRDVTVRATPDLRRIVLHDTTAGPVRTAWMVPARQLVNIDCANPSPKLRVAAHVRADLFPTGVQHRQLALTLNIEGVGVRIVELVCGTQTERQDLAVSMSVLHAIALSDARAVP